MGKEKPVRQWEYHVEVIKIERGYGDASTWTIHDSAHGEVKLANRLNEFGKFGWNLVSLAPMVVENEKSGLSSAFYAIFKRSKE